MNRKLTYGSLSVIAAGVLYACGGGGGGVGTDSAGIGGTGVSANGSITGFGSIFVNGIEFETDNANIMIDGVPVSENDLSQGMIVRVDGSNLSTGVGGNRSANASTVSFDGIIEGPVATEPALSADLTEKSFSVLGVTVVVDERSTVFRRGVTFANIALNNRLTISGFFDANGALRATYVALDGTSFTPNVSEVEARGVVENYDGSSFDLRLTAGVSITVNVDGSTDLDDLPNDMIVNGLFVEVEGTIASLGATTINASEIEDDSFDDNFDNFIVTGSINSYVSNAQFNIGNQPVDASNALFSPRRLETNLGNGAVIQVQGRVVNGVLVATSVEQRRGDIEIESRVQSVDLVNNVITMMFPNSQSINVNVTFDTQFEDDDDDDSNDDNRSRFGIGDIRTGDFLEIEAYLIGGEVFASEIERERENDGIELQGPVSAFDRAMGTITILGVTYNTNASTEFEDGDPDIINASQFFRLLNPGDVVGIEDDNGDGIADEVEFEDSRFGFRFNDFGDDDDDDDDDDS